MFNHLKRRNIHNQEMYDIFKEMRNKVNIELRRLKKEWYEKKIEENCRLEKIMESVIKSCGNKKTCKS